MHDLPNNPPAADRPAKSPPSLRTLLVSLSIGLALVRLGYHLGFAETTAQAALLGQPGVVTTNDGKTLEGDITENADDVTVSDNGIVTTLPRGNVRGIEYGTPEQRLKRRLDALPADDYAGRLALANEGLRQNLLDFAQTAAEGVLASDPGNPGANALLDNVSRQRRLNNAKGTGVRPGNPGPGNPGPAAPADAQPPARPLNAGQADTLGEEQINLVRQAELQPSDAASRQPPRIQFRDEVVKRYGETQKDFNYREFNAQPDVLKALAIFAAGDGDLRKDVRVTSNPPEITEYLRGVEPFVLNGCATSACHGGTNAGSFVLYRTPRDEAASYTNFYTLNKYTKGVPDPAGNAFGGGEVTRRMIDRNAVDDSLLLSYLLPADQAKYAHPKVEGYNGLVGGPGDQTFQLIRNWISGLSKKGGVEAYGFDFKLPSATTAPAADQ